MSKLNLASGQLTPYILCQRSNIWTWQQSACYCLMNNEHHASMFERSYSCVYIWEQAKLFKASISITGITVFFFWWFWQLVLYMLSNQSQLLCWTADFFSISWSKFWQHLLPWLTDFKIHLNCNFKKSNSAWESVPSSQRYDYKTSFSWRLFYYFLALNELCVGLFSISAFSNLIIEPFTPIFRNHTFTTKASHSNNERSSFCVRPKFVACNWVEYDLTQGHALSLRRTFKTLCPCCCEIASLAIK